jgi:large subunit ribosomal protein L4
LLILDSFQIDAPKTKVLLQKLQDMKIEGKILIVTESIDENLYLASRNLHNIEMRDVVNTASDPAILVGSDKVIITEAAIKEIEGLLK